jgi:hypothetical protein
MGVCVMYDINNVNKLILKKVLEICFVLTFIFASVPLSQKLSQSTSLASAAYFDNASFTSLNVTEPAQYFLYPISNKEAINTISPYNLEVVNDTLTLENYTLYLKIEKTSTLDYNALDIEINDNIYSLNTLDMESDDEYYWFVIDKNSIKGDTYNYSVKIWMDENTGNNMQGRSLSLAFDLVENSTEI